MKLSIYLENSELCVVAHCLRRTQVVREKQSRLFFDLPETLPCYLCQYYWPLDKIGGCLFTELGFRVGFRVGFSSWIFELDFRVGFSSWVFQLDFQVGFLLGQCEM